ncbi:MAG: hypothetical protein AAB605_01180 [Patescibacteria group bacterium]
MKIHPIVAGVSNVIIPGLGYLLIKRRIVLGVFLLLWSLNGLILTFVDIGASMLVTGATPIGKAIAFFGFLLFSAGMGYDAYSEAKKI